MDSSDQPKAHRRRVSYGRLISGLFCALLVAGVVPAWWCGRDAKAWWQGDRRVTLPLARTACELKQSASGLIETYPGETYPPDNAVVLGSLGLHRDTTGTAYPQLSTWLDSFCRHAIDPQTHLLYQATTWEGDAIGPARGSGTALAAYCLAFVDMELSASFYNALRSQLGRTACGFAAVREYPIGVQGSGDIDSGPVVGGLSISGTGFAVGAARRHDYEFFRGLYSTIHLTGAPVRYDGRQNWVCGGSLGNAIILAMLTAGEGL